VLLGILALAVVIGGTTVYSVPAISKPLKNLIAGGRAEPITVPVHYGPLPITVIDKGNLESSANQDAYAQVEGQTTIIFILPEGQRVKKGELVCELDSASLRDQLVNQQITTKSSAAAYENAKLTREVAEIAVKEYVEGIYVQDMQTVEGEIKLAESDLSRSEDRLDWARRMFDKGYVSLATKNSEELTLKKARFALEQAQSKKKVLTEYTKPKTIKELQSEVEKTRSDELAKKATMELENTKEKKLEKQIAACKITAPSEGLVVYANDPTRAFMSNAPQIEEGATVRERQKIFSLPDISKMQVNTKVHESQIEKITRGLKARIRVESAADQLLEGTVEAVNALPDTTNMFSSDIKVYTTKIRIDVPSAGLRPGMSAEVEILVDRKEHVLSVPVQAIIQFKGKDHVTKKVGDRYEQVEVELGANNEKYVEVTKGLSDGDLVVMDPVGLMTDGEKQAAFGSGGKGSKKAWGASGEGDDETKGAPGGGPPGIAKSLAAAGPAAPGKAGGGDPSKAKAKPKGAGGAGKKGGRGGAAFAKLKSLSQEERQSLWTASDEERTALLKKAGLTDEEMQQMAEARKNFGGGGGAGFGGGGPGGGGGRRRGGGPPGGDDGAGGPQL
jgi:HlyD family secretion protein